jgi:hypothetical protein
MNTKASYRNYFSACAALIALMALAPLQAQAKPCSTGKAAGDWAYTYTGSLLTANGFLPAASVGRYTINADGTLVGSQVRSVAGSSGEEDIAGTVTVNVDCTATATIGVYVNGQLQRTTVLAVVYDNNMNHARAIFQSVVSPDNTNIPVVITSDNTRVFPGAPLEK